MSNISLITSSKNTIYIITRYNNNYLDAGNVNKGKERNRKKKRRREGEKKTDCTEQNKRRKYGKLR